MRGRSVAVLMIAATMSCSAEKEDQEASARTTARDGQSSVSPAAATPAPPLRAGDVRIVAIDGGIDLSLIGDTVSSGLSQETLAKVKKDADPNAVRGSGFAASIEKLAKTTVQSAIGTRVSFPLSDIRDARYENGRIQFDWTGKPHSTFTNADVNRKPLLESFSADDARRFVEAVQARKNQKT